MKPEEINAAIAKSQGWKWIKVHNAWRSPNSRCGTSGLPNYHGSLDEIVPVVRALPYLEWDDVMIELMHMSEEAGHEMALATPAQWCEAYLKAKGLWK